MDSVWRIFIQVVGSEAPRIKQWWDDNDVMNTTIYGNDAMVKSLPYLMLINTRWRKESFFFKFLLQSR